MQLRFDEQDYILQGGVLSGLNPVAFTTSDPIRLWIVQIVIIILMAQLLALVLGRIRQPRVIAEVIGGIILGPTVMGRIPNFSASIFPDVSLPYLNLTATVGLVLFLFLTALEVDVRIIQRNAKSSTLISLAGIAIPFGMGAGIAVPIYNTFVNPNVNFSYFLLFTGVAMSITAFPVLCRILTELKLLNNHVGVITLSAGVGNDVVGWVLLALTVALVNASGGLTALYVFLSSVAWTLFLLFPVKWVYYRLAVKTGSIENGGPTPAMMIITLLIVFISAFMTDILGVHAIFGGFIAGLIIPHEGGFAISLVERFEDLVTLLLIPIYFTLSGLKTNLGLLDTGITWGYTILLCVVAFVGKFFGCAITARLCKFTLRESSAIGVLMSCKGLVELIVLNIGLQANILDQRLFSMFVVMALVLTFVTTPLALAVYPPEHRIPQVPLHREVKKGEEEKAIERKTEPSEDGFKSRFSVILNRIEHLPAIMTLTQLLQPSQSSFGNSTSQSSEGGGPAPIDLNEKVVTLDAIRLIELTERTSAVMQSSEADEVLQRDALASIFQTFGHLNSISVSATLSVVSHESFPASVESHVHEKDSDMVIIPWHISGEDALPSAVSYNPFDGVFGQGRAAPSEKASSVMYSQFVRRVFSTAPADVTLFIDRGVSHVGGRGTSAAQHILVPFMGGPDDRIALEFAVQFCANPHVTATILRIKKVEQDALSPVETGTVETESKGPHAQGNVTTVMSTSGFPDTIYALPTTQTRMESENADNLIFARYAPSAGDNTPALPNRVKEALTRVKFDTTATADPLHKLLEYVNSERTASGDGKRNLLVLVGRGRRMAAESHHDEIKTIMQQNDAKNAGVGGETLRTVGDMAAALLVGTKASVLVMQAALPSTDN
ncbi:hypothetical protein M408DRAFT_68062 [Serendipita vermifera MAFF 305830]|uniref:Cation/H+ exchanger transmembrane domain-containing protein n=1 Tax=Serendipita vermifera MAFF 305830 TaxID=933852 RepID=A0A0C3AYN4_SERVB|nr:hypothetical protein M408DRAFT_68062 [Serendipita vermifera MAFF 305830]